MARSKKRPAAGSARGLVGLVSQKEAAAIERGIEERRAERAERERKRAAAWDRQVTFFGFPIWALRSHSTSDT